MIERIRTLLFGSRQEEAEESTQSLSEVPLPQRTDYDPADDGMIYIPLTDVTTVMPDERAWGNNIEFSSSNPHQVHGWITPHASEGDLFAAYRVPDCVNTSDKKYVVYKLTSVENISNPRDMFFADIVEVGLLEREQEPDAGR